MVSYRFIIKPFSKKILTSSFYSSLFHYSTYTIYFNQHDFCNIIQLVTFMIEWIITLSLPTHTQSVWCSPILLRNTIMCFTVSVNITTPFTILLFNHLHHTIFCLDAHSMLSQRKFFLLTFFDCMYSYQGCTKESTT